MSSGDGGCGCSHGGTAHVHDSSDAELGVQFSLYQKIDMTRLHCLNEQIEDSGKTVFKAWEDRLDRSRSVLSDADDELLFNIPFTGNVKLKSIVIIGGDGTSHPSTAKLYKNRPTMTFDDTSATPEQEFALAPDPMGTNQYPVKVVKFSNISSLSIHFPHSVGGEDEACQIYYIGLRGEFTAVAREQVVIATYEARAMLQDHKGEIPSAVGHDVM